MGNKKINVIIGKANNLNIPKSEKIIAIGSCVRGFAERHNVKNLNKCPPTVKDTLEYIKEELNY